MVSKLQLNKRDIYRIITRKRKCVGNTYVVNVSIITLDQFGASQFIHLIWLISCSVTLLKSFKVILHETIFSATH